MPPPRLSAHIPSKHITKHDDSALVHMVFPRPIILDRINQFFQLVDTFRRYVTRNREPLRGFRLISDKSIDLGELEYHIRFLGRAIAKLLQIFNRLLYIIDKTLVI